MRSQLTLAALLAAAPTALAQQSWTPLVESGATGRAVQGSPLQPRLLTVGFPFLGALEATYAGGSFEADPNSPHQDLGYLQAVTYDPQGLRAVAYLGEFTGVLGEAGESSIAVHDGTDWTIVPTPSLSARQIPVFVADPIGGGLVLFGGMFPRFPSGIALGDTWRLVGTTWTQLAPAHSPPARLGSAGAVDPVGGTALIFGGRSQQTGGSYFSDTWRFDGNDWTQLAPVHSPPARHQHALAALPDGSGVMLYGGTSSSSALLGDAWLFDGSDWTQVASPLGGTPLSTAVLVEDGADLLLFGRISADVGRTRGFRWNGTGWDQVYASGENPSDFYAGYALDVARGEVVRFGGRDGGGGGPCLAETWIFDGAWQLAAPATVPPARYSSPLVYDPLRDEVVVSGGHDCSAIFADTWVWDGTDWQQRTPAHLPNARYRHSLEFDPSRGTVVLSGGIPATGDPDTWEWDGTDWAQIPVTNVPPSLGSLAYDGSRNVLCWYADRGSITPSELWELQSNDWVLVNAAAPPYGNLTYDPTTGNLALFALQQRYDFVGGAWVATGQPSVERDYDYDPVRGGLLALSSIVSLSTSVPAERESYGTGCGVDVDVTLGFDRAPRLGAAMQAIVRCGPPSSLVYVFYGIVPTSAPFGPCTQWIDGLLLNAVDLSDGDGWARIAADVPPFSAISGLNLYAQAFVGYPAPLLGQFGLSNGVRLQLGN